MKHRALQAVAAASAIVGLVSGVVCAGCWYVYDRCERASQPSAPPPPMPAYD